VPEKLAIMEQISEGLAFAHANGVVHRDLKPGNIHILPNGKVKILDFGLARRSTDDAARTSVIMGTPYYMAPEQAQGERATVTSDVFSLGAVFYELLSGKRPFTGDSIPSVLFGVVHREPEPLTALLTEAAPLLGVLEKALAKDPTKRYPDAAAMWKGLLEARAAMEGGPPTRAPQAAPASAPGPSRPAPPPLSAAEGTNPQLKLALQDIREYLADKTPPLMVADSVTLLLDAPPDGVASDLLAWAERQREAQPELVLADLVFHALSKLHAIGEFGLVDQEALSAQLRQVGAAVLEFVPFEDRERLRRSLVKLGESEMVRTGPIGLLHRQAGEGGGDAPSEAMEGPPAPGADRTLLGGSATSTMQPEAMQNNLRRLSLLEQRLQQEDPGPVQESPDATRSQLISETLAVVAAQATNEKEFEDHLRRLRPLGVASGADEIFRSLGRGLADWVLPPDVTPVRGTPRIEVEAMRRIIALAEEPIEAARRFRHLVYAAIEQFNEGNLGRAVPMFELAMSLYEERKIDAGFVETVRRKGHESLDMGRLRQYMVQPERHLQLRVVVNFFSFGLGHGTLLDELQTEPRRDRRRFLLDLLEVHGPPARATARERLQASEEGEEAGPHIQRNWIYLLRLIPRPPEEAPDEEIELVARLAGPGQPSFLVREAVTYLSQTKHVRAKQALVGLLHDYEHAFSRPDLSPPQQQDWQAALDKITGALARFGAPSGWSELLDHALSREAAYGSTMSRLTELQSQDLSGSPELVGRILAEIKANLPRGVLSLLSRRDHDLLCLIEALAGTPAPEVRATLEDVADDHSNQSFGKAAMRVLDSFKAPPPPPAPPNLAGDFDALGLPGLLHRLSHAKSTGSLILHRREAGPVATLVFEGGALRSCRHGRLEGEDALYQLLERSFPGTFTFEGGSPPPGLGPGLPEVTSLIVEAVRRAGELQRASALVPDDASLQATGRSPSSVPDEADYALVVSLWERACAGIPPRRLEGDVLADAFRIRRALAHWLQEGALRLAPSTPAVS